MPNKPIPPKGVNAVKYETTIGTLATQFLKWLEEKRRRNYHEKTHPHHLCALFMASRSWHPGSLGTRNNQHHTLYHSVLTVCHSGGCVRAVDKKKKRGT